MGDAWGPELVIRVSSFGPGAFELYDFVFLVSSSWPWGLRFRFASVVAGGICVCVVAFGLLLALGLKVWHPKP